MNENPDRIGRAFQASVRDVEIAMHRAGYNAECILAESVASLCDVALSDMMSFTDTSDVAMARWLYWYASRYMTHDTYDRIARRMTLDGCTFTARAVGTGINKMSMLIERDVMWQSRWTMVRDIIRTYRASAKEQAERTSDTDTFTITVPAVLARRVKIKIKED